MCIVQLCNASVQSDSIWAKSVILCHYYLWSIMKLVGIRAQQPSSLDQEQQQLQFGLWLRLE